MLVGIGHSGPVVRHQDGAAAWIDAHALPLRVNQDVARQAMNILEAPIAWLREDPALVALLEVMAYVHERSAVEGWTELVSLGVARDEASEPIIGHADGRNDLAFAQVLQARLRKDSKLASCVSSRLIWIRRWENLCMMQKGQLDSFD